MSWLGVQHGIDTLKAHMRQRLGMSGQTPEAAARKMAANPQGVGALDFVAIVLLMADEIGDYRATLALLADELRARREVRQPARLGDDEAHLADALRRRGP